MDPHFWHQRWQDQQIGFHQADIEPLLQKHWPHLGLEAGSSVFVPLCGKSLDMVWLAGQQHKVIGNELSEIALDSFFDELNLTPDVRHEAGFTVKSAGPYELWCGDYFALPAVATEDIAAIYDRAALIALPSDLRKRYAAKLVDIIGNKAPMLLITLEYDQSILPGPPHSVLPGEVHALFSNACAVTELAREQTKVLSPKFKEHGLETVGQTAYVITPRRLASQ